jgi:hypothetical protein
MKIYRRRAYIMTLLTLSLVIPGVSTAQSNQGSERGMNQIDGATSGVHDFDFLVGHWRVHHRKLKERKGAVAFQVVSDLYIALFVHFIPPGVWEAIYIIEA